MFIILDEKTQDNDIEIMEKIIINIETETVTREFNVKNEKNNNIKNMLYAKTWYSLNLLRYIPDNNIKKNIIKECIKKKKLLLYFTESPEKSYIFILYVQKCYMIKNLISG